jgi:hypothetical protein
MTCCFLPALRLGMAALVDAFGSEAFLEVRVPLNYKKNHEQI